MLLCLNRPILVRAFSPLAVFSAPNHFSRPNQHRTATLHTTSKSLRSTTDDLLDEDLFTPYYKRPVVQWYPGHIAKAERQLQETIKAVDVVLEVRDARIPTATMHPKVPTWCAGKPRILVMTHKDAVMPSAINEWHATLRGTEAAMISDKQIQNQAKQVQQERIKYEKEQDSENTKPETDMTPIVFVNAKQGVGIRHLKKQIIATGEYVHTRRKARGLLRRPLRVGCLGFPNTGKSALINQLLGRRRARTANTPGITRTLQWIRVSASTSSSQKKDSFELLDSPGIIPVMLENQEHAKLVAICNCIGEAAYDTQGIASHMCQLILDDPSLAPEWHQLCTTRYRVRPGNYETGDDILHAVADSKCQGSLHDAARKLLQDVRTGRMGPVCLQRSPWYTSRHTDYVEKAEKTRSISIEERTEALLNAEKGGVELPEGALGGMNNTEASDIGKGLFDGW